MASWKSWEWREGGIGNLEGEVEEIFGVILCDSMAPLGGTVPTLMPDLFLALEFLTQGCCDVHQFCAFRPLADFLLWTCLTTSVSKFYPFPFSSIVCPCLHLPVSMLDFARVIIPFVNQLLSLPGSTLLKPPKAASPAISHQVMGLMCHL